MASFLFSPSLQSLPSPLTAAFSPNPNRPPFALPLASPRLPSAAAVRSHTAATALAESNTSNSLDDEDPVLPVLQELSRSLSLPPDYLSMLPSDLRLDLNDAAFDLASGPVVDECDQEVGELLLDLSRAWEQADTMTSNSIASKLPSLHGFLTDDVKSALGKRLLSAGRRFETMGQYGQGEPQRIAKAMIKAGKLLSSGSVVPTDKRPKKEVRTLKFGDLQVPLTREKANIGAAIAFAFGLLSWELSQGIEKNLLGSFSNDIAKSLRGFLLVIGYSSTILSAFASVGLLLFGRQLSSQNESKEP